MDILDLDDRVSGDVQDFFRLIRLFRSYGVVFLEWGLFSLNSLISQQESTQEEGMTHEWDSSPLFNLHFNCSCIIVVL
jgi:hypothetical protein